MRNGNTITTYKSSNGTSWTQVGTTSVTLPSTAVIGLYVSSVNDSTASTATFDNVTIAQNSTTSTHYKYSYTNDSDSPDLLMDNSNTILERYIQLPGGVLLTKRASSSVFSLPNVHGDVMATTDAGGASLATFTYDPFGNATTNPNNTAASATFGWVGQHEKTTETALTLQATQMGARVYLSVLGRFLQVDPVEGGASNDYVYPPNPIGGFDLDGSMCVPEGIVPLPFLGCNFNERVSEENWGNTMRTSAKAGLAAVAGAAVAGGAVVYAPVAAPLAFAIITKVGVRAMDSKSIGVTSKRFGNPTIANSKGINGMASGVWNNTAKNVRAGWSVKSTKSITAPVFRIKILNKHIDLLIGRFFKK